MAEMRKWVDLLLVIEFAVNNTPNCTTGYMAFYLNYVYHLLHLLQLFNSLGETKNEFVVKFTSRLQGDFQAAMEQLHRAQEHMKKNADQHCRAIDYAVGDVVLLNTEYLRFKNRPKKLQKRFMGPFQIKRKISKVAYELDLPVSWSIHPIFHNSLLKPWWEAEWSCLVDTPIADLEVSQEPVYQVERILKWWKAPGGYCGEKEVLVTRTRYPLEEARWINEKNFTNPAGFKKQMKQDHLLEETNKP